MRTKKTMLFSMGLWLLLAGPPQSAVGSSAVPESDTGQQVLLRCVPAKRQVFVGEPFTITYQLLRNITVKEAKVLSTPLFRGLNAEEINRPSAVPPELYHGKNYNVTILKQVILRPDKPGQLVLEPLTVRLNVELPPDPADFFPVEKYQEITLSSAPISVAILPLPITTAGRAPAIGKYKIKSSVTANQLKLGDIITYQVQITGTGNATSILPPALDLPAPFEVYPPTIMLDRKLTTQGPVTSMVFKYQLVPTDTGTWILPALPFTYFDTQKGMYVTLSSARHEIKINGSPPHPVSATSKDTTFRNPEKQSEKRFIWPDAARLFKRKSQFFGSFSFFAILLLSSLLSGIAGAYFRRMQRIAAHPLHQRKRKAWSLVNQRLTAIERESREVAYSQLIDTILVYLSCRLESDQPILTTREAKELLQPYLIPAPVVDQLQEILACCYEASFARDGRKANLPQLCHQTKSILKTIEKATR